MTTKQFHHISLTCRIDDPDAFNQYVIDNDLAAGESDETVHGMILEAMMRHFAAERPIPGIDVFAGGASRNIGGYRFTSKDCLFGDHRTYLADGTGGCRLCPWVPPSLENGGEF